LHFSGAKHAVSGRGACRLSSAKHTRKGRKYSRINFAVGRGDNVALAAMQVSRAKHALPAQAVTVRGAETLEIGTGARFEHGYCVEAT